MCLYIVTDIKKKRLDWIGLDMQEEGIREGQIRKYLRVNQMEVDEVEDLD